MLTGYVNRFNRGEIDPEALARDDVTRIRDTAALMTNFWPKRLGPMQYRPGSEYLGTLLGVSRYHDFIAATDDTAALEFSNNLLRFWVSDALVARTAVTTTITNGTFDSDLTGWTDNDGSGATSAWLTGGYLSLIGTGAARAERYQTLTTDTGNEHGLRIVIAEGPVTVQLGTTGVGSHDILEAELKPGTHSFALTPSANLTITFSNNKEFRALVDSVAIEGAGTLTLPTSVAEASLDSLRKDQSADICYFTYDSGAQFQIERRGTKSWSIVDFRCDDGPFNNINDSDVTLTPGALSGNTTLTASKAIFTSDHVGRLYKVTSSGQNVSQAVSVEDNGTNAVNVTGVQDARKFEIAISGTFVATVTLQRSADETNWEDITTYTTAQTVVYDDGLDNADLYYRLWVKTGDYTSGTATLAINYAAGSIDGICRALTFTSTTVLQVQVLTDFGATDATRNWYAGTWNADDGYPSAVGLYEGRLWFAGKSKIWGSVSDAYTSFDREIEGDSKSIQKTIGFGPNDTVYWLAASSRLIMGIASAEVAVRSSAFGEVLTATNCNLKTGTTQGAANVEPVVVDNRIYFVQRAGIKPYSLDYSLDQDRHEAGDTTLLHQEICSAGIKRIGVAVQPETRMFVVLDDGNLRLYGVDPSEDVSNWSRTETDGNYEDIVTLPRADEDAVYVVVNRTGGRYLEKFAKLSEARGGNVSKHFDSFETYSSPGTTITGLDHLEGKTVGVWADGQDRGTYTVSSGQITVASSWTDVVVGLVYTADYKSNKLAKFKASGTVLNEKKRVVNTGLVLRNYWPGSLTVGPDTSNLNDMPLIENGAAVDTTATLTDYDYFPFPFDGRADTDARVHMRATGPVTVMALTYGIEMEAAEGGSTAALASILAGNQAAT